MAEEQACDVLAECRRRVVRNEADAVSREIVMAALKCAVDLTHEAGTFEETVQACLANFWDAMDCAWCGRRAALSASDD